MTSKKEDLADRLAALEYDFTVKFGDRYSIRAHEIDVVITGREGVISVFAEVEDFLREVGYSRTWYRTKNGKHGSCTYLDDGRIQKTYYTKEVKKA